MMKSLSQVRQAMILLSAAVFSVFALSAFADADGTQHKEDKGGMGHSHEMAAMHGGEVTMTKEFHFEVAFERNAVNVYVYDGGQKPISAKGLSGTVTVKFKDDDRAPVTAELAYAGPSEMSSGHEMAQDFLRSDLDMSKVQEGEAKAVFVFKNLPGDKEKEVTLKQSFTLARLVTYACPMNDTEPTSHPGDCPKCGMTMKRVESIYACPMHAKVTSREAGEKCFVCGMEMKLSDGDEAEEAGHDEGGHGH